MWYLPDRYKIGSPGIPRSTFNFDAYVMRLLPLMKTRHLYIISDYNVKLQHDKSFWNVMDIHEYVGL